LLKDALKSNDFLVYSKSRELIHVIECKYIGLSKPVKHKDKYVDAVLDRFNKDSVYVVNDEFFELFKTVTFNGIVKKKVVNLSNLRLLLMREYSLGKSLVNRYSNYQMILKIANEMLKDNSKKKRIESKC
jgi:hypothetical protein